MSNKRISIRLTGLLMINLIFGCGKSFIDGSGNATINESTSQRIVQSNLEVISFGIIEDRLLNHFKLTVDSEAYKTLVANQNVFDVLNSEYSALFQTTFTKVMSHACHEVAVETFFPGRVPVIDHIWTSLTSQSVTQGGAKEIESDILKITSGQTNDVKRFGLCMAAALDPRSIFVNYN